MSKLQDIRNLVQEHAVSVSSSPGDWMDYMDTASRLYRYSFSDQLLIHAQRPDATACASLELWNEKMLRWVNRGARGIALFDETWQNTKLRYVFDISDTHMVAGGRSPYLWKMQEHQREEILTHLAEVYALEEKDAATLQDALMAVAREMVNDNLEEYLDGLEYATEGTYLEDLDEVTIRSDFRQLATDSVYYLLSRRCGLDPMELLEEEDFMHITDYNRLSVLTFLGNAASQLSESILIDIGKTVHKISLEEARKEVENSNERNYNNFTTLMRETKNRDFSPIYVSVRLELFPSPHSGILFLCGNAFVKNSSLTDVSVPSFGDSFFMAVVAYPYGTGTSTFPSPHSGILFL